MNTIMHTLAIIGIVSTVLHIYAAAKYFVLCKSECRRIWGYWKVPFREVYCENLYSCIRSIFECHVWLRIHPPKFSGLPFLIMAGCVITLMGCVTIHDSLPAIRLVSAGGTAFAVKELKITVQEQQNIYGIAIAVNSITGGNVAPTVEQLKTAIGGYITTPGAQAVGNLVTSIYEQYYPKLAGNAKDATDVLQAISGGMMDALAGNSKSLAARKNLPLNVRIAIWQAVRGPK